MLVARVLVVPLPNHLFSEDSECLRKLINALRLQFEHMQGALIEMSDCKAHGELHHGVSLLVAHPHGNVLLRRAAGDK